MTAMNEMELEQVNGAHMLEWRIPNFPSDYLLKKPKKETYNYKLPEMDVDNRPAIDLSLHRPTPQQV